MDVPDVGQGSVVARCEHAALGNGDPEWRDRSLVEGRLGFYGSGATFEAPEDPPQLDQSSHQLPSSGPILGTKVPVVVEGTKPVGMSIAPADCRRSVRSARGLRTQPRCRPLARLGRVQQANRIEWRLGIWHETFLIAAGSYECVYNNMPPVGLGEVTSLVPAAARPRRKPSRGSRRTPARRSPDR